MGDGEEHNLDVLPPRSSLEIVEIHLQSFEHLLHGVCVAVVERSIRGDSRTYLIEILIAAVMFHNLVDIEFPFRTWSDE